MKPKLLLITVLVAALALGAAIIAKGQGMMHMMKGPGEFKADYKTSGEFFTLMDGMKMGKSPHGEVQIWYSTNIKGHLSMPEFKAPVGTVAIKPYKTAAKEGIAVMVKKEPGYDAKNGDWYYEMRGKDGKLMKMPPPGKIDMCIKCHAAAAAKDYLAGTEMK